MKDEAVFSLDKFCDCERLFYKLTESEHYIWVIKAIGICGVQNMPKCTSDNGSAPEPAEELTMLPQTT